MRKILQIVLSIFILYATIEDRAVHGTDSINYAGGTIKYLPNSLPSKQLMKNSILNAQRRSIDPDSCALHFVQMTIGDPTHASWIDTESKLSYK